MRVRVATEPDLREVFEVRREVFCREQGLFSESDRDRWDERAIHLVAETAAGEIAGTVRLYEKTPGIWYGGRLAVREGSRGGTGFRLVRRAVTEAALQGAREFLAEVQERNEKFFHRLGWTTVGPGREVAGVAHVLMRAPLEEEKAALGLTPDERVREVEA